MISRDELTRMLRATLAENSIALNEQQITEMVSGGPAVLFSRSERVLVSMYASAGKAQVNTVVQAFSGTDFTHRIMAGERDICRGGHKW